LLPIFFISFPPKGGTKRGEKLSAESTIYLIVASQIFNFKNAARLQNNKRKRDKKRSAVGSNLIFQCAALLRFLCFSVCF